MSRKPAISQPASRPLTAEAIARQVVANLGIERTRALLAEYDAGELYRAVGMVEVGRFQVARYQGRAI